MRTYLETFNFIPKMLIKILLFFLFAVNAFSQVPQITVLQSNNPAPGRLIFATNSETNSLLGVPFLFILNNDGSIFFQRELPTEALTFRKQKNGLLTYQEYLVLHPYYGLNSNYNIVDSFKIVSPPGDIYITDLHELQVLPNGHALILGRNDSIIDMSQIVPGGDPNCRVTGNVIQEIDENNNLLFQWQTFGNFLITDAQGISLVEPTLDPWHVNAIDQDLDGNILISTRHLNEITKINRQTGAIMWRLGGPRNQFTFTNDNKFTYQHDIRRIANGNITLFDNGNLKSPQESRAVEYQLNEVTKVCTRVFEYKHNPPLFGNIMGSVQRLPNGNTLIGWGSAGITFTEVTPTGTIALEMTYPAGVNTYRVQKTDWPPSKILNLTALIEGFYNPVLNLMVPDSVTVYIRNALSPFSILDSAKTVLSNQGTGSFIFNNAVNNQNYYLSVRHRNSIRTWSNQVNFTNDILNYNFTTSLNKAYGNNLTLKGSKYCIYSGDVNQDGVVNLTDVIAVYNDQINFVKGRVRTNLTGNGIINLNDLIIVQNNNGVQVIRP